MTFLTEDYETFLRNKPTRQLPSSVTNFAKVAETFRF